MQKFTFFFQSRRNSDFSEESTQLSLYSRKLGTTIFNKIMTFRRLKYKLGGRSIIQIIQIPFPPEKNNDIYIQIFIPVVSQPSL